MSTRVGFLRAVNVGKRTVAMKRLAEVVRGLGHDDVWTHINSGNVVFDASGGRAAIERELEGAFEAEFGFEVTTFVRSAAQLRSAIALEPFDVAEGDTYYVTFLKSAPGAKARSALEALSNDFDTLVVDGAEVHWLMHGKSTDSPLAKRDWERILGPNSSTSRNTTMLRKLVAKLG